MLFQLWRPVTATLFFPITPNTGFLYLVNLYFLYHYSTRLETGESAEIRFTQVLLLFLSFCVVFQERLMADQQIISSCCSSTGSASLYP